MHDGPRPIPPGTETFPEPQAPRPPEADRHPPAPLPLHSDRITLRRLKPGDLEPFLAYRCNPEVGLYQGWTAMSSAEALTFLEEMAAAPCFPVGHWFQLAIADRLTDQLMGDIGIHVQAPPETHAELGFTLHPAWQGKGLGREAVSTVIQALFTHTPVTHIVGITDARNHASIRLLERVGMQKLRTEEAIFRGEPCLEHTYLYPRPGAAVAPLPHSTQEL